MPWRIGFQCLIRYIYIYMRNVATAQVAARNTGEAYTITTLTVNYTIAELLTPCISAPYAYPGHRMYHSEVDSSVNWFSASQSLYPNAKAPSIECDELWCDYFLGSTAGELQLHPPRPTSTTRKYVEVPTPTVLRNWSTSGSHSTLMQ